MLLLYLCLDLLLNLLLMVLLQYRFLNRQHLLLDHYHLLLLRHHRLSQELNARAPHLLTGVGQALLDDKHPLLLAEEVFNRHVALRQLDERLLSDVLVLIAQSLTEREQGYLSKGRLDVLDARSTDFG